MTFIKWMRTPKLEILLPSATLLIFLLSFFFYFKAEQEVTRIAELRYRSFILADELRQSSEELTRMARTYVVTGDARYKKHYQELLDIRNGKIARPKQYTPMYWALKIADSPEIKLDTNPAISFRALIKNSKFPDQELNKLLEAEDHSNELAILELHVMKLIELNGKNSNVDRLRIIAMLFNQDYHKAKVKIMEPISDLYSLMAERINASILKARQSAFIILVISILWMLVSFFMIWSAYTRTLRILGADINVIQEHFLKIGHGDLSANIGHGAPNTVLAYLVNMQKKLRLNASEKQAIDEERRISAIAFETQDGIIISDTNNNIIKVNHAFTRITGYSMEEALGKNPSFLQSDRHDKNFYSVMWHQIKNTGAWLGEIWNRRKDGDVFPSQYTITAVRDAHGISTNYVATFIDISKEKITSDEIKRLAFYDPLTQLPNRRLLIDRIGQGIIASARNNNRGAILFADLDHFKNLNDTLGHGVGDLLLQKVAERLTSSVRKIDTVARIGGDEFVVLLSGLNREAPKAVIEIEIIVDQIQTALNKPYQLGTHSHSITGSIGVAMFDESTLSTDELLQQADIAMYRSKSEGRNTFRFFDKTMQDDLNARVRTEKELLEAIKQEEFRLFYQVQVSKDGQPFGVEALIRWMHPKEGLLLPSNFIAAMENLQLITPVSVWVLNEACAQLKLWEKNELTRLLSISINISAEYFHDANFILNVQRMLTLHSINPGLLLFELTESLLFDNIDDTIEKMHALNEMGIKISLDDFGTGYSSLQYLSRLPLKQIKIDQSFVRNIFTNKADKMIIHTIILMAESMGLEILAEGVETEDQRKFLLDSGCLKYQGFLFGRPVPIDDLERSLGIQISHTQKV